MSAILSIDDLNDFISPGVACVKPIETLPPSSAPGRPHDNDNDDDIILDGQQVGAQKPAQISLTDCLACSGCVTSAEAVLVSLQSHAEVISALDAAPALRLVADPSGAPRVQGLEDGAAKLFVASVSPQTRANLAAACGRGVTESQAGRMLESLLRQAQGPWSNAFTWVVDTNVARDATLVLGADEVLREEGVPSRPILASSCPGWVCYAEKSHPYVLPHLSRVKSPQAMMGTMLKTTLSRRLGIPPNRIWHMAVMPCFDKKLEASREELTDEVWAGSGSPGRGVRDVDCVITSKEVLMLAESRGVDFFALGEDAPPQPVFPDETLHRVLFSRRGLGAPPPPPRVSGSSGGLLHHVVQRKAAQTPDSEIQVSKGRNADVVEFVVAVRGEPVFKAARYYGFRNIQNLVRRLRPAKPSRMPNGRVPAKKSAPLEYGYVEVMACPGGCTNGGGQITVDDPVIVERKKLSEKPGPHEQREWLAEVDEAYFSGDETLVVEGSVLGDDVVGGISHSHIHGILAHWSDATGISLDKLAYTSYREVISNVGKDAAAGAENVAQLAGKVGGGW